MIRSFADKATRQVFNGRRARGLPGDIQQRATYKLAMIDAAEEVEDLRSPPGNRLERLSGDREGAYSIRVNEQWRICFRWEGADAYEVEITDYY